MTPIQVTGPPSQRLNLIIMGDGYQKDQQSLFYKDLDRNLAVMWATEPFRSYRNYINVYAVEIASIDYGVRCDPDGRVRPPDGTIRDTGEREGPDQHQEHRAAHVLRPRVGQRLHLPLARGVVYGSAPAGCNAPRWRPTTRAGVNPCETGSQAHNRILDNYVAPVLGIPRTSQNLQTLAIFNSFTYGGIGGTHATTSGGSPQGPLISLHEIGHSLGTLADEYLYFERDLVRPCNTSASEPSGNSGFHHTLMTSAAQMIAAQHKWFRWLGEESLVRRQDRPVGGRQLLPVRHPAPEPALDDAAAGLRLRPGRPRAHGRPHHRPAQRRPDERAEHADDRHGGQGLGPVGRVRPPALPRAQASPGAIGGPTGEVIAAASAAATSTSSRSTSPAGTVVTAEVRDPVGPTGIDWVRNPSTNNAAPDSGFNGSRFVQTAHVDRGRHDRDRLARRPPRSPRNTANTHPVASDEVVYVETNHPADRVLPVTWTLNGTEIPNPRNSRNLDLGDAQRARGHEHARGEGHRRRARRTRSSGRSTRSPRPRPVRLSTPLTHAHRRRLEHPVYFGGWDMWLDPKDDTTGYTGTPAVVGQFRLNGDGWFNYFGFPEKRELAVRVPPLRPGREGADLRQPRHGRPLVGRLQPDAAGRPPDRPPHPGLRHALRRAPGDRPGRQLRQGRVLPRDGPPGRRAGVRHDRHRHADHGQRRRAA